MQYIGIDLGTSSVKILLMKADGTILSSISKDYPVSYPKTGWSEQNPEDWLRQTLAGLKELLASEEADQNQIKGIGIGGQMHGLVALDEKDQVIRPAILWNDGRTEEETEYLNTVIGTDKLSDFTANIAFAGFTAPKILWMQKNEPEKFQAIQKIMLPKDYLVYKLTGAFTTDVSDASGMLLLDVKNRAWSKEMIEICGIQEQMLPEVKESYDVSGFLKPEFAGELGLTESVAVVAGAGDNAAAAIGTGTVEDGSCNVSIGTSGTVFIASDSFRVGENNAIHSFGHANGKYHLMGCMLSAASCLKWWLEDILKTTDYQGEQQEIKGLGDNPLYFLPYLMGERSPHNDPNVRGAFFGLGMDTTRAQMVEAVFEGVSFALKDSLEIAESLGIEIKKTKLCGGGAKSPVWQQILANILNIEVELLVTEEGPALGGAILAAVACGEYASVEDAARAIVKVKETIKPQPELTEAYARKYQVFRELYPAIKGVL
ncbi:xylulokinase [Anoxybacterium hadale]|uniref:Xylulokinase n=1 Tax=Anoxybacterium hadale TaxID=3408580 RepID=A0ACD1AEJ7_9FIRM|nr:xylulokinase [Clostridiales bacterium]